MATIPSLSRPEEEHALHLETTLIRLREILVATDFSKEATEALKIAAWLARRFHSGLHVLYAETPRMVYALGSGVLAPSLQKIDRENAQALLHKYLVKIPEARIVRHEELVLFGPAAEAIRCAVEARGIDLVVVGSHGRSGLRKVLLGSVAEAAVRHVQCPVLIVGPNCVRRSGPLKSMLFATGLRAGSLRTAQYATSIALESGAALTVVHVLGASAKEGQESSETAARTAVKELSRLVPNDTELKKRVHFEITSGERVEEILRIAQKSRSGLIVMGVREHGVLAHHAPQATLSGVVRGARCPVLAVRPHLV